MPLKSLDELKREFMLERAACYQTEQQKNKRGALVIISDILFYLAILIILFSALIPSSGGSPRGIMGYSYFTVLTSSMQDEIPKGSFILARKTDPQKLAVGDNITYIRDRSATVTHKIVDIYENYQNSGARGFQTKGVNNTGPDKDIVYEANVVGKVILVLPAAGAVIYYLGANIHIVLIFLGLGVIISLAFRALFIKSGKSVILNGCWRKA